MSTNHPRFLREDRRHGAESFRCGYYATEPDNDSFIVSLHWHEEPEIIYFQNGHFTVEINMERYEIESECLFFVRSGELHRIVSDHACTESALVFSPYLLGFVSNDAAQNEIIAPFSQQMLLLPRCITPDHACYADILASYHKIAAHLQTEEALPPSASDQLHIKAGLLEMLALLSEQELLQTARESNNENIDSIKKVLSFIHEHYAEKIFVKDLAALLNLNEQYFCRFFRKSVGQSPISYLNGYRIRRAMDLLNDTDHAVTEICLECGFHNLGNFLREFRSQTSTTPLQYRLNQRGLKSK